MLLYNSFVLPHLSYCAVAWGNNYSTRTNKLFLLQKRALRIIHHKPYLYPSNQLFFTSRILKFSEMVHEQNIVILLAYLNNRLPPAMSELFNLRETASTRIHSHFEVPFT